MTLLKIEAAAGRQAGSLDRRLCADLGHVSFYLLHQMCKPEDCC